MTVSATIIHPLVVMITEETASLTRKQLRRFYEPLLIYESLAAACRPELGVSDENEREPGSVMSTARDRFDKFIYKFAYICAFDKGPNTVTSISVLQNNLTNEIMLLFGANQITEAEGLKVGEYIKNILQAVSQMEEPGLKDKASICNKASIRRTIFKEVLTKNRGRIEAYLKAIKSFLVRCLEHDTPEHHGVNAVLLSLQRCLSITFPKGEAGGSQYMQACVELIRTINKLSPSEFQGIRERAKGHMTGSQDSSAWSGLQHCISRLKAYDQAVDVLIEAGKEWPEIFQIDKLTIHHVPSSKKMKNPLGKKSMDVDNCIGRMTTDKGEMALFREFGKKLQKFELNQRIEAQGSKVSFQPFVHSEVLLYDWIMTRGKESGFGFFRGWKYIGSSKPTCKLCDYFFDAVGGNIGRRPCHGNVYINWGFPPGYGSSASDKRFSVYMSMNTRIRKDAFKILVDKAATGKSHDSDTYSCWTTRQTEAESTQAGDTDARGTDLSTLVKLLSLDDDKGSVRGEASDQEDWIR